MILRVQEPVRLTRAWKCCLFPSACARKILIIPGSVIAPILQNCPFDVSGIQNGKIHKQCQSEEFIQGLYETYSGLLRTSRWVCLCRSVWRDAAGNLHQAGQLAQRAGDVLHEERPGEDAGGKQDRSGECERLELSSSAWLERERETGVWMGVYLLCLALAKPEYLQVIKSVLSI